MEGDRSELWKCLSGVISVLAPDRFADWLDNRQFTDKKFNLPWRYHPRSDEHSKILARYIWEDLLQHCPAIRHDANSGRIMHEINFPYTWTGTKKGKTIDLAIGRSDGGKLIEVLISCELKATMTEHGKSKPRVFDELNSSHQIVHAANPHAIAAGLTVVNIADRFISPTNQERNSPLKVTEHRQPYVTEGMVEHLRGLPQRTAPSEDGFDAYCTFLVDCDNDVDSSVQLCTKWPAPQPGDADHYGTFLSRICRAYTERYG